MHTLVIKLDNINVQHFTLTALTRHLLQTVLFDDVGQTEKSNTLHVIGQCPMEKALENETHIC